MSIVSAISNGTVILGIIGSYAIYKEAVSLKQLVGCILCFAGILVLSLSVFFTEEVDESEPLII